MTRKFDINEEQSKTRIPTTDNLQHRLSARKWMERNEHYFLYEVEQRENPDFDTVWNYSRYIWTEDSYWKEQQTEVATWLMDKCLCVECYRDEHHWYIKVHFNGILHSRPYNNHYGCINCGGHSNLPFAHLITCEYYKEDKEQIIKNSPCFVCNFTGIERRGHITNTCPACHGKKYITKTTNFIICQTCEGKGTYYKVNPLVHDYELTTCLACDGDGKYEVKEPDETLCPTCNDDGFIVGEAGIANWCTSCSAFGPNEDIMMGPCGRCNGEGYIVRISDQVSMTNIQCVNCNGAGQVPLPVVLETADNQNLLQCIMCEGSGLRIDRRHGTMSVCNTCHGIGGCTRSSMHGMYGSGPVR